MNKKEFVFLKNFGSHSVDSQPFIVKLTILIYFLMEKCKILTFKTILRVQLLLGTRH